MNGVVCEGGGVPGSNETIDVFPYVIDSIAFGI